MLRLTHHVIFRDVDSRFRGHTHTHSFNDGKAAERCVVATVTFVLQIIMLCFIMLLSVNRSYLDSGQTDRQWLLPNVNRQKMNPPIITPVIFLFFINGMRGDPFGYQRVK